VGARIRVLLANLPLILAGLVERVLDQADLEVVGVVSDHVEVLVATGRTRADVVVLGIEEAALPGPASHLLEEYPHAKVLAVTPDGRRAFLYELRPHLVPLGEASPARLLDAIRNAVNAEVDG
jgi:DNA-binding NarL/FixJ family response regulator